MKFNYSKIIPVILIIVVLLLIPFGTDSVNVYGCEITAHKAALYTIVRIEAFGFTRTKICFFPSNLDANNNLAAFVKTSDNFNNTLKDLL